MNFVIFDGTEYELNTSSSEIYDYGCDGSYCNYDFDLYAIGETYVYVYIELYEKSTGDGFAGGNFAKGVDETEFSYWEDDYIIIGEGRYTPASGSVKATPLSGTNEWKINFNYTLDDGKKYSGNYTGVLPIVDGNARLEKK